VDVVRIPDTRRTLDAKATEAAVRASTAWFDQNF
jgi:hypothetical protein